MAIPQIPPSPILEKSITVKLALRASAYVKNAFILCLREAYSHPYTPAAYRYDKDDPTKRQIGIYRVFPKRVVKSPMIVVETHVGDASISTLGDEEGRERWSDDGSVLLGREYFGVIYVPTTITVMADTTVDRETLGDLTMIYVRTLFKDLFNREQMPFLDIQAGEDGEEERDGANRFFSKIEIKIQTEFQYLMDQSLLDIFQTINLQNMLVGSESSDEQSNNE